MTQAFPWIRGRLDRMGMLLSCLCAVHCVVGIVIVAGLGLGGSILLDPIFHRAGLLLAMIIAGVAIGVGAIRHRRATPAIIIASSRPARSEEHTSELQSRGKLVCRLLIGKKKHTLH